MCVGHHARRGRPRPARPRPPRPGRRALHPSETFRRLWADHNVRTHGAGTKRFHHPVVGELTLAYEELAITAEPGLVLMVYTAEPGSPSAERLRLLASWAAPPSTHPSRPTQSRTRTERNLMQITRSSIDTAKGPADWFTGDVYIDSVAAAPPPSRLTANLVHFMPGARTHWHRHPLSQTVFVTEGVGLCQRRGGPVEIIRPGDRVLFEADEEHWHGAAPNRLMVHLAINEGDDEHDVVHWLSPSPTRSTPRRADRTHARCPACCVARSARIRGEQVVGELVGVGPIDEQVALAPAPGSLEPGILGDALRPDVPHSDDQAETPHPAAAVGRRAEGLGNDGDRSCRRDPCASGVRVGPVAERCGVGQLSATADEADVSEQPIGVGIGDGPTHVGARLDPGASSLDEAVCIFQAVALVDDVATQPRDRLRVRAGLLHPGGRPSARGVGVSGFDRPRPGRSGGGAWRGT